MYGNGARKSAGTVGARRATWAAPFYGIPGALFRDGFDVYARKELHKYRRPGRLE